MLLKDLEQFSENNWHSFYSTVTETSREDQSDTSLVISDCTVIDFDKVCLSLFLTQKLPTSVDAIRLRPRTIELIEFKTGFRQKITRESFDPLKGKCKKFDKEIECDDYWDLFFENQERKKNQLISSIRLKAIESIVTLEKHILPQCQDLPKGEQSRIVLTVVVDIDPIDAYEDMLSDLTEEKEKSNTNTISDIRKALGRLMGVNDIHGNIYYFDQINVMSGPEFKSCISREQTRN